MPRKRDYSYVLPPERIAQVPAGERAASRLLVVRSTALEDRGFAEIGSLLPAGSVIVMNDSRVIPARLHTRKPTGGAVELLFLEPREARGDTEGERWQCLARSHKPLRPGTHLAACGSPATIVVASERAADSTLEVVVSGCAVHDLLDAAGEVPLPPYIERPEGPTPADRERYQTVYADEPGAVAAPTAGLHFTHDLLTDLRRRGCALARLTLHVGWGTFAPVRDEDLDAHVMHAERYSIPEETATLLASGRPVVAVGTTVVRALESAAAETGEVAPGSGVTRLFIRPGFRFRAVDHLITNFHLPGSTLLMLVAAFAGHERIMHAYRHAVAEGYRFYSYGDAMLLEREADI
jgi:S-adenosylmethionine:tRNA ribosyltransferase-isomerase